MVPEKRSLDLQISLDGMNFATGRFPPSMHPETHVSRKTMYIAL